MEATDMELQPLSGLPGNSNTAGEDQMTPRNGTCSNHNAASNTENSCLLPTVQCWRELARVKKELNEEVFYKLRLWMIILMVVIVIAVVIFLAVLLCAVYREDEDELYDPSSFVVPHLFSGNFTVHNQSFMLDAPPQSPADHTLLTQLQQKITDIYCSSHVLKRYFSRAETKPARDGTVGYELLFLMPEEHTQLVRYTLSREVVYSVFLQQLLEQHGEDPLYIQPSSLSMRVRKQH
ncbi:TPA-induced transmembrane protein isoform X2 [Electrophorus electricus]|uniref:TPA-induced transmembrane protein isoform X2 n=1 Tax=Electrophorus electricus TaxID=8005 RepID=UPI0015CF9194|nr:TPA-induced transmembrane protein isoform X2 [Electrophorus electricus]